jgi:hypothetical protein
MSNTVVVSIPHQLGKPEAKRRLQGGFARMRDSFPGLKLTAIEETWNGDHLDFRWGVMGQSAGGSLDVEDDHVRLEITLPWLLARLAGGMKSAIQKQGQLLLEKK